MIPKLENSKRFIEELNKFKKVIETIENPKLKENAISIISDIYKHIHIIDEAHNPLTNNSIDPRKVRENVEIVNDLRVKIKKIINDSLR
jgi:predicted phage-related endonuclease